MMVFVFGFKQNGHGNMQEGPPGECQDLVEVVEHSDAVLLATDGESVIYPYYDDVLKFRRSSGRLMKNDCAPSSRSSTSTGVCM